MYSNLDKLALKLGYPQNIDLLKLGYPQNIHVDILKLGYTNLSHIDLHSVFPSSGAIGREDGGAVAVGISIDQFNGIIQGVNLHAHQDWSKDFLSVTFHLRLIST